MQTVCWPLLVLLFHASLSESACNGPGCRRRHRPAVSGVLPAWISSDLKPDVREHPASQTTRRSHKVVLNCTVSAPANANVTFTWKKDDETIELTESKNRASTVVEEAPSGSQPHQMIEYANSLLLEDFEDGEQGVYQCLVHSLFGSVQSKKARITLHTVPYFARAPGDCVAQAGETARFECSALGDPEPVVSWSKKDEAVFQAARERRMQIMPQDKSIHILAVKAEDEGVYVCRAENDAGVSTASARLTVIQVPHFVRPMRDKQVTAGQKVVLECVAGGSPKPSLTWTKEGSPLVLTKRHFLTADNQLLIIVQTNQSDSGRYSCQVSNSLGQVQQSLLLQVAEAPFYRYLIENFTENWTSVAAYFFILLSVAIGLVLVLLLTSEPATRRAAAADQLPGDGSHALGQTTILAETELEPELFLTRTPDVTFDESIGKEHTPCRLDIGK